MSFEQNYGVCDPPTYDDDEPLSDDEMLEKQIEYHMAIEEIEMEEIKEGYRRLKNAEKQTSTIVQRKR